jgi:hypothetical protein
MTLSPGQVIPEGLSRVVDPLQYWFVIGGHAVRCFSPYRPSRDVDFGVHSATGLNDLLSALEASGPTEVIERTSDTAHLRWSGVNVSIFELALLSPHTEDRRLTVEGILATKLHAILDRGMRRDFFDLYVMMQQQKLGILLALKAMHEVYRQPINDSLVLRALTYFDDADREARLPGEGADDWEVVRAFFVQRVADLLVPPTRALHIQTHRVDVRER